MKTLKTALLLAGAVSVGAAANAGTIKKLRVAEFGHDHVNRLAAPIYATATLPALKVGSITSAYDPKAKIVRGWGNLFTKGPTYDLGPGLDLGALLADSIRAEAAAMGFKVVAADSGEPAWEVKGSLKDIHTESQQMTGYGAVLSYGFLDADLEIRSPGGETQNRKLRAHTFFGKVNMGFGRKDEAEAGLAHLVVEGAQDIVARLNREFFKAPPLPAMDEKMKVLAASGVQGHEADLHAVGLSGAQGAVAPLLTLLEKEPNEDNRSPIINALARLGSAEVIDTLANRYDKEDEDCRWYTLKAMDYIGGDKALAVMKGKGTQDQDEANKRLIKKLGVEKQ